MITLPRRLAAPAALLLLALPGAALAQSHSLQGQVSTSTGVTDNANLAPENPDDPNQVPAVGDAFSSVSPALVYTREGRRVIHIASYRFDARLFFDNSEANSYTNQLDWQGVFLLSRRSRLGLNAALTQGETNNFQAAAQGAAVEATPAGGVTFATATAGQSYNREFSDVWSGEEQVSLRTFLPLGADDLQESNSYELSSVLRADRSWAQNALGLVLRSNYFITTDATNDEGDVIAEGQQQLLVGPEVRFRRDLGEYWSAEAGAGVLGMSRTDDFDTTGVIVQPTAAAIARYNQRGGSAQLSYERAPAPNLLVGEIFVNDSVQLNLAYPLSREERVFLRGGVGFQRGKQVDFMNESLGGDSFVYLADTSLAWEVRQGLELAARYQYRNQNADSDSSLQSFTANTFLVSFAASYPNRQRRPTLRRSSRVDGRDAEDPFGDFNDETDADGSSSRR